MDVDRDIRMRHVRRIHFIGIGGAGMGGIAEVLHNLGYTVTGSDLAANAMTRQLDDLGIEIKLGHAAANVNGSDAVVFSSAIAPHNPELIQARNNRIPVVPRAEMLAEIMRFRYGIAVAGTHGKTTTTSLIASVLAEGGLDPTFVIGGRLVSASTHARLGSGRYLVAEADESDASFLHLDPMVAVLTNIDADHLSTYQGDFEILRGTFLEFLHRLPFYGLACVCLDDETAAGLVDDIRCSVVTYGTVEGADIRATNIVSHGATMAFTVEVGDEFSFDATLNLPGRHNVINALAAIAVAHELRVDAARMQEGLRNFQGIDRRFQLHGELRIGTHSAMLVDDYGHHPKEVAAVLDAVHNGWPGRRLLVIFQPHRYTRTRDLFEDFVRVLSDADQLVILDVYPAGEEPLAGADGRALCRAIRLRGKVDPVFAADLEEVPGILETLVEEGDLVMTLGAGSVGRLPATLTEAFAPPAGARAS